MVTRASRVTSLRYIPSGDLREDDRYQGDPRSETYQEWYVLGPQHSDGFCLDPHRSRLVMGQS